MKLTHLAVIIAFFHMGYSKLPFDVIDEATCGTTKDAVLSDCRDMLRDLGNTIHPAWERECKYDAFNQSFDGPPGYKYGLAYNPFCSPGKCCFYTDRPDAPIEHMRKYGEMLLGCGAREKNLVNGRVIDEDGYQYCLSDGSGCGDCFAD